MQLKEAKNSESRDGDSLKTQVTQPFFIVQFHLFPMTTPFYVAKE
jgi:hypothetical protein